MLNKIAIVSINEPSLKASLELKNILHDYDIKLYSKSIEKEYSKLDNIMSELWHYDAVIFFLATGIVVRKIAPFLEHKTKDPAILVVSLDLLKVLPLLSGHIGGANELSELITKRVPNSISFTTTATDQTKTFAFDMFAKQHNFEIKNIDKLAKISNALIDNKTVHVKTYPSVFETITDKKNLVLDFTCKGDLCVNITPFQQECLSLHPKVFLGIGCNRDTTCKEIEDAVMEFLSRHNLKFHQIQNIASFVAKADEQGLLEFAKQHNFNIKFFDKKKINNLDIDFSKSQATKFFGLQGVAEPSAVLISHYKELIIKKEVYQKKVTIAGAI
ncbi:cobalamin biosynthesis protein [Sulfurospirillum arcachonense]|uniref:cobalamin biosynthesis protein n=1 Tax=Sulfurospirillum arcachonense TaxID=57666 RepID=UPI000468D7F5|nr:cobalamin biosynthesis protein [Sulfurospirillum arcachonense]